MNPYLRKLDEGIWQVDLGYVRDGKLSAYIVVDQGEAALIDCGTASGLPRWEAALDEIGIAPEAVRWVLPTHVHLDHAAASGHMMARYPNAELRTHPKGLRHLIDPERLEAGTRAVYGDELFDKLYGTIVPVEADRSAVWEDGEALKVGQRELVAVHTPGHADHHLSVHVPDANVVFAGDAFGIRYGEVNGGRVVVMPSTSPTQFRPDALADSARRLAALKPRWIGLAHFSVVDQVDSLLDKQLEHLEAMTGMVEQGLRGDALTHAILDRIEAAHDRDAAAPSETIRSVWLNDAQIDAQGLEVWYSRSQG
jgi:glyoxylase-like metal-dependent hydrolase (beta-lactamase superfamily II)